MLGDAFSSGPPSDLCSSSLLQPVQLSDFNRLHLGLLQPESQIFEGHQVEICGKQCHKQLFTSRGLETALS